MQLAATPHGQHQTSCLNVHRAAILICFSEPLATAIRVDSEAEALTSFFFYKRFMACLCQVASISIIDGFGWMLVSVFTALVPSAHPQLNMPKKLSVKLSPSYVDEKAKSERLLGDL